MELEEIQRKNQAGSLNNYKIKAMIWTFDF
jgi:hypothetical protein